LTGTRGAAAALATPSFVSVAGTGTTANVVVVAVLVLFVFAAPKESSHESTTALSTLGCGIVVVIVARSVVVVVISGKIGRFHHHTSSSSFAVTLVVVVRWVIALVFGRARLVIGRWRRSGVLILNIVVGSVVGRFLQRVVVVTVVGIHDMTPTLQGTRRPSRRIVMAGSSFFLLTLLLLGRPGRFPVADSVKVVHVSKERIGRHGGNESINE